MRKVAIVHGTKGSPEGNWFPWLAEELKKFNVAVTVVRMPTPEGQSLSSWSEAFSAQFGELDEKCILIGHSIGAVFLLHLLGSTTIPISMSVFVSGLTGKLGLTEYDLLNASFLEKTFDWNLIRKNAGAIVCLSGLDDPYVPLEQSRKFARNLGVDPYLIPSGGHLNSESGFKEFPYLLDIFKAELEEKN